MEMFAKKFQEGSLERNWLKFLQQNKIIFRYKDEWKLQIMGLRILGENSISEHVFCSC